MRGILDIRKHVGRIKARYPVFRKYPLLLWLLLPVILLIWKGITALGFGTVLVVISGFLYERYNMQIPKYLVAIALFVFLFLLIWLIYRIFFYKSSED
jgi:hypothetical protein